MTSFRVRVLVFGTQCSGPSTEVTEVFQSYPALSRTVETRPYCHGIKRRRHPTRHSDTTSTWRSGDHWAVSGTDLLADSAAGGSIRSVIRTTTLHLQTTDGVQSDVERRYTVLVVYATTTTTNIGANPVTWHAVELTAVSRHVAVRPVTVPWPWPWPSLPVSCVVDYWCDTWQQQHATRSLMFLGSQWYNTTNRQQIRTSGAAVQGWKSTTAHKTAG